MAIINTLSKINFLKLIFANKMKQDSDLFCCRALSYLGIKFKEWLHFHVVELKLYKFDHLKLGTDHS